MRATVVVRARFPAVTADVLIPLRVASTQLQVARPPPEEYEVRLIVWRTKGVKSADTVRRGVAWGAWQPADAHTECHVRLRIDGIVRLARSLQITDQNDLYIKAWVQGEDPQETDTHWRCKKGKVRGVGDGCDACQDSRDAVWVCIRGDTAGLLQLAHEVRRRAPHEVSVPHASDVGS